MKMFINLSYISYIHVMEMTVLAYLSNYYDSTHIVRYGIFYLWYLNGAGNVWILEHFTCQRIRLVVLNLYVIVDKLEIINGASICPSGQDAHIPQQKANFLPLQTIERVMMAQICGSLPPTEETGFNFSPAEPSWVRQSVSLSLSPPPHLPAIR